MKPLVVMCSPDYEFYLLLAHILNAEGFDASLAEGAAEALARMTSNAGVALIVDCQTDAFRISDWVREIRATSAGEVLPIAVFVGAGNQQLYLEALKAGVDEIFVRPFNPDRLLSYLGGLLPQDSSRPGAEDTSKNALAYAEITMLLDSRRVEFNDTEVRLSPIEFRLLQHFLRKPGYVFSRDDLIQGAWPHGLFVEPRTVDVHVGRLRRALKNVMGHDIIRTVRAAGYAVDDRQRTG